MLLRAGVRATALRVLAAITSGSESSSPPSSESSTLLNFSIIVSFAQVHRFGSICTYEGEADETAFEASSAGLATRREGRPAGFLNVVESPLSSNVLDDSLLIGEPGPRRE